MLLVWCRRCWMTGCLIWSIPKIFNLRQRQITNDELLHRLTLPIKSFWPFFGFVCFCEAEFRSLQQKWSISKRLWCVVFDINALIGQNLMSNLTWWGLIIAFIKDIRFLMHVLGTLCCHHIHRSQLNSTLRTFSDMCLEQKRDRTFARETDPGEIFWVDPTPKINFCEGIWLPWLARCSRWRIRPFLPNMIPSWVLGQRESCFIFSESVEEGNKCWEQHFEFWPYAWNNGSERHNWPGGN